MSTTFHAATDPTTTVYRLMCEVNGVLGDWADYGAGYSEAKAHMLVCTDSLCQEYGADVEEITGGPADVNIGYGHAVRVLHALGYITDADIAADEAEHGDSPTILGIRHTSLDLAGGDTAANFLGRVLVALAVVPADEGMPGHEVDGVTFVGWSAGDLQQRLTALHELAVACVERGLDIFWG